MPSTNVVAFPKKARTTYKLLIPGETSDFIVFPFSKVECDIINAHLRERSPELCDGIADPSIQDVIERFLAHIWREGRQVAATAVTIAPTLAKTSAWYILAIAVLHLHCWWGGLGGAAACAKVMMRCMS